VENMRLNEEEGAADHLSAKYNVPILITIPFDPVIRHNTDLGIATPKGQFKVLARKLLDFLGAVTEKGEEHEPAKGVHKPRRKSSK